MLSELYKYQYLDPEYMSRSFRRVFQESMSLGKTGQVVAGMDLLKAKMVLIITHKSHRQKWKDEVRKWGKIPRLISCIYKSQEKPRDDQVSICAFEYACLWPKNIMKNWDLIIIHGTCPEILKERFKEVWETRYIIKAHAKATWQLNDSLFPSHPGELWPLLRLNDLTNLDYEPFTKEFCEFNDNHEIIGAAKSKMARLRNLLIRVKPQKEAIEAPTNLPALEFQMPEIMPCHVQLDASMSFVPYVAFKDRTNELFEELKAQKLTAQTLLTGHPGELNEERLKALNAIAPSLYKYRAYTGLQKAQGIVNLLRQEFLDRAHAKIVVFCAQKDVMRIIVDTAKDDLRPKTLYANTHPDNKRYTIRRFELGSHHNVLLCNYNALSFDFDLTAANTVILAELTWNTYEMAQAIQKVHRFGQRSEVKVIVPTLPDQLEQDITRLIYYGVQKLCTIENANPLISECDLET